MNAKKCDRCKQYYMPYAGVSKNWYSNNLIFGEESSLTYEYVDNKRFELCPNCMDEIVRFIRKYEENKGEES